MFVAIKDDKIIAHNETGDFLCLVCDEIREIDDVTLVQVDGEFLPDTDERVIELQNEQKIKEVKATRDEYMQEILAKVDRYKNQKDAELETTDSEETYKQYLLYLQYLRDIPQLEGFPNDSVKTFEEWRA